MSWHADPAILERYASGRIDDARAYSLEAHVQACNRCRDALARSVDRGELDRMWTEIEDLLDAPGSGAIEAILVRLGVREHIARLLAATPSLRLSWLAGEALALGFALVAANTAGSGPGRELATLLFLVVAAVMPVGGVAVAYGPGFDPTHEIGLAAPMRSFRLLLIRAAAVLCTSTIVAAVAALALPTLDWRAAAWTLPALGLVLGSLALATWVRPLLASSVVTFAWVGAATAAALHRADRFAMFRAPGQIGFVLIIVLSALVLARRGRTLEQGVHA